MHFLKPIPTNRPCHFGNCLFCLSLFQMPTGIQMQPDLFTILFMNFLFILGLSQTYMVMFWIFLWYFSQSHCYLLFFKHTILKESNRQNKPNNHCFLHLKFIRSSFFSLAFFCHLCI